MRRDRPSRFPHADLTVPAANSMLRAVKASQRDKNPARIFLGIDGGGTRTVALAADETNAVVRRLEFDPADVKRLTDRELFNHFRTIQRAMPHPVAIGLGLAEELAGPDLQRVRQATARVWPSVPCHATHELEITLLAARPSARKDFQARILIVSEADSYAFGKSRAGEILKIGGWGQLLGDQGSAHEIGRQALRAVLDYHDVHGKWPALGERLLSAVLLNVPSDLVRWAQSASKADVARLGAVVFAAGRDRDPLAREILRRAESALIEKALVCARRIARRNEPVEFIFAGNVLLTQPAFARGVAQQLRKQRASSVITLLDRENVWGAVKFARRLPANDAALAANKTNEASLPVVRTRRMSPTEQRNPRSQKLDQMPIARAVRLMITEDARIHRALLREQRNIAEAVRLIVNSFRRGGRLFYVGAGTSGRLGVLDASECPVTFRTPPELVQGIIAGGQRALWQPVEGAEDDAPAGANALNYRGVNARDVFVGIAASGTTRFLWGALQEAQARHARTVLLAFNPFVEIPRALRPDVCILPDLGPEILTGSTRLKAGGATKLVLNTLTTLAMVQIGKVASNLMVDVVPTNVKLRDRATRIVQALTGRDYETARATLQRCDWVIKTAAARLGRKSTAPRPGNGRPDTRR